MTSDLTTWALPRIERLLPLDHESLKQIIEYADSLPKDAAAEHLKNLLGDSPQALEFISSFNSRRRSAPAQSSSANNSRPASRQPSEPANDGIPRARPKQQKKKANIHNLPARQVEGHGNTSGAYVKQDEQDYMASSRPKGKGNNSLASALSLSTRPEVSPSPPMAPSPTQLAVPVPASTSATPAITPKTSRTSSPAPQQKAKVTITGGKAMHGSSSTLSDLDSAIRSLELQTNPLLSTTSSSAEDLAARKCSCMATTHPLLTIAPNCLTCGNIICVKQGLGPCTSCGTPLMSRDEIAAVLGVLKGERGKERQAEGNKAHKRAEVATKPRPFTGRDFLSSSAAGAAQSQASSLGPTPSGSRDVSPAGDEARRKATEHRDKLLGFQAQNAKRTTVHDEAADYSMPVQSADGAGPRGNVWASPAERALELKRQQRVMREWEFNSRPEWERRKVVASIDVVKGKVVRRFVEEKFRDREEGKDEQEEEEVGEVEVGGGERKEGAGGAFSRNPLLGKMIRPTFKAEGGGEGKTEKRAQKDTWRRVQDDLDDNEDVILDGGVRGFGTALEVA
ncbi:C2HC5 finger protein [Myriangium duriaei CBS 260.36]|uniref:C2HC5 finger protein n=1 Tax=Myriangium duriaei CBS 260.36 TaxID=1168546 RepID=A0A9P4IVL8_9PEZI|nr:C2HC5 finger protein [Myriangium duriaei CBS 260.36]